MGMKQDDMTRRAGRYLKTGDTGSKTPEELAAACSRLVRTASEQSSDEAIRLGHDFVRRARYAGANMRQTAHRALGWAYLVGGRFRKAEKEYLTARGLVSRNALNRGRIDRILVDVYMYLAEFKEARRRARMAMATFTRIGDHDELAKARVHYANLLHRQDRHKEAQKLYNEAGRHFEKSGDELTAAFCYHNEANTLVQLFRLAEAAALFGRAEEIFASRGYDLRANGCRYGLAWLHLLEGKYHIALQELADCEREYRRGSQPREVILCLLDRAEVYLGLNLYTDARRAAAEAEKLAHKLGIVYEAAKAALFGAKASLAIGRLPDSRAALRRAEKGFAGEQNDAFLGTVELASIQINRDAVLRTRRINDARRRFAGAQLPLWEAVCDLQILTEWPDETTILKRLEKNPAVQAVPHLLARWHTMKGDREARRGKTEAAGRHWQRACEVLDAVRAKLPPIDLRTAFLKNQGDPYCRLIDSQLNAHPARAAAWSEKFKTAGLWQYDNSRFDSNPDRVKAEKSLAELAAQVTAFSSRLESAARNRSGAGVQTQEAFAELQERVRYDLARLDTPVADGIDSLDDILDAIITAAHRQPVIQFHAGGSDLIAFVHHKNATRFHTYVDGVRIVRELMARWRFHIEKAPYLKASQTKRELADERSILQQIGDWLFAPLELSSRHKRLLILPEGGAANLPWQAIVWQQQSLAERFEVLITPSLRHYLHARRQVSKSDAIRVFVGNVDGLPQAAFENNVFAEADGPVTICNPCRRSDWPDRSRAHVWHYSGHARLRSDNPFYSYLEAADGPVFAADFRLKRNTVDLLTLAACRTGQQSLAPGEEAAGLVRSLLEMGARNVLASHWAVADKSTADWMTEFYRRFLSGDAPATAVRHTSLALRERYPSAYHWAAFSLYGAG